MTMMPNHDLFLPHKDEMQSTNSLATLVQSLPQELYDEIYNRTFSTDEGTIVDLENDNTFPATLYVDSRSRRVSAHSYYIRARFTFKLAANKDMHFFFRWIASLSDRHYYLINTLINKMDAPVMDKTSIAGFVAEQKKWAARVGFGVAIPFLGRGLDQLHFAVYIKVCPGWEEGIMTESWFAWTERLVKTRRQNAGMLAKPSWEYLEATLGGVRV